MNRNQSPILLVCRKNLGMGVQYLHSQGIQTVINYPKALPFYKAYEYLEHKPKDFPNAFQNQSKILSLPIFPEISDSQISYVCSKIKMFTEHN